MNTFPFYNNGVPELIRELADTKEMLRLKNVGMNCGCEYTSFPLFSRIDSYSRYTHSIGTGLITWHFTVSPAAAAAALLHDIATPVFAHTVDFLNGDYIRQESTEERTAAIISSSEEICGILSKYGLKTEDVQDYHRYPVADNDSPRLSADRLEYTLGNGVNYGFISLIEAENLYSDLKIGRNEDGEAELCFSTPELAERFAFLSIDCSKVYVSPEDRYSMQMLSELLKDAIKNGILQYDDLYMDEPHVIKKLTGAISADKKWKDYRSLSKIVSPVSYPEEARIIPAKKRRIDPLISGLDRVSTYSSSFKASLDEFMSWDFSVPVAGK